MTSITLSDIQIYPVKSTAGQARTSAQVADRGLADDRRWMVVDPAGHFLTGRELPRLTLIRATLAPHSLLLAAAGMTTLTVPVPNTSAPLRQCRIWKDRLPAHDAGAPAARWLSRFLDRDCRLVHMADEHRRPVAPGYSKPGDIVSFADGFPLMLIGAASLADLNTRLEQPVSMAHFRPNLVTAGSEAFAEDNWRRIRIGVLEFDLVKPCSRCIFTTIDPQSAQPDPNGEPLKTLASYRRDQRGRVMFGVNLIARGSGQLHRGDPLTVLD